MSDKKNPKVDEDSCIGCTLCTCICPHTFKMEDNGKSRVFDASGESEEKIDQAINECPVKCIYWE